MNVLIPLQQRTVSGEEKQTVNARDLHEFLEVGKDYSNWIKDRIEQFGFVEGEDYIIIEGLSSPKSASSKARAQATIDYYITIDMAKELSMVERNKKGKQARRYFIECEKITKGMTSAFAIPRTLSEALRLAANQQDEIELQKKQLAIAAPKIQLYDVAMSSTETLAFVKVANVLYRKNLGRNNLIAFLRDMGILKADNTPYQEYLGRGYFDVIEKLVDRGGVKSMEAITQVFQKGVAFISELLNDKYEDWYAGRIEQQIVLTVPLEFYNKKVVLSLNKMIDANPGNRVIKMTFTLDEQKSETLINPHRVSDEIIDLIKNKYPKIKIKRTTARKVS